MRPNETKRKIASGKPAIGIFASTASPLIAEVLGGLGFDWVLVDLQHGENNLGNLASMLTALSTTSATPFVRVPANDAMLIQRSLDLGAYGIIVPMVNTKEQAEVAVQAAKYAPRGNRSWGPIRGSIYGGADYFTGAGQETMVFAMLETAEAVRNAREILAVDGIDGCYIGPNDLSISLGIPPEGVAGLDLPDALEEALATVLEACRETGKIPGMQLYAAAPANHRARQGFRLIGLGTELRVMRAGLVEMLRAVER